MKYSESQKKKPFNWPQYLRDRIAGKPISDSKKEAAENLAGDWVTCACGNQCSIIPRDYEGEPDDSVLANLGMLFYGQIETEKWKEASHTLAKIEDRSAAIIAQIHKEEERKLREQEKEAIKFLKTRGYSFS